MPGTRLHTDEVGFDDELVAALVAARFPAWSGLPLRRLRSTGTDNVIFRLGDRLGLRIPRLERAVQQIDRETRWMPHLAAHLPVAVHEPVAIGAADGLFPFPTLVFRWIEGADLLATPDVDAVEVALDVAAFLRSLRAADTDGAPEAGRRGRALGPNDAFVRRVIGTLDGEIDTDRAVAVWDAALAAGEWERPPVWVHGDVLPGNLLVRDGRLTGVIDWSSGGAGDPACDSMFVWGLPSPARTAFREALGIDDATWARGRGWALEQAASFIPYYRHTIPAGVEAARRRLDAVLVDDLT